MIQETSRPESVVLDLIVAFRRSKTMFAAVSLGVFDALESGPKSLGSLSETLKVNQDGLERLLDGCVGLQLLKYHQEGLYENTLAAASFLCKRSPSRMTGYISYSNDVFWKLWGNLEDAVREGTHRWKQTFPDAPQELDDIFRDYIFRTDEAKGEFMMGMHGYGQITSPRVVRALDLSRFKTLVDLGGGTGHLVIAACKQYPNLNAKLFDLPEVVPLAERMIGPSGVASRIEVIKGDFFKKGPLPDGDLYALARTLHDWTETKVVDLLSRICKQLPSHGAILIAEKLLREDKSGPDWAQMQNLNMLTCAEGKERTLSEYRWLLDQAGSFRVTAEVIDDCPLDVILAQKA
jgi:acetylserotonin O-methyltransferase